MGTILEYGIDRIFYTLNYAQIENQEFEDVNGVIKNIVASTTHLGKHADGEEITLTRNFLNTKWRPVAKYRTFQDAYKSAVEKGYPNVGMIFAEGSYYDLETIETLNLSGYGDYSLKNLAEDKAWDSFEKWTYKTIDAVISPSTPPSKDFGDTVAEMVKMTTSYYMIQHFTGKKIYLDSEGIKDASTNELVKLELSLYNDGQWYYGEIVGGTGEEDMDISTALNSIDWNTQRLVFAKGTTRELSFDSYTYQAMNLKNVVPSSMQNGETIKSFLLSKNWSIVNI